MSSGGPGVIFRTTLAPEWLGQAVRFPTIEGANGRRLDVPVDVKNEGAFQQLTVTRTMETNSVPSGADWVDRVEDRLLREDIQATFQGGGTVSRIAGAVTVNGEQAYLEVAAGAEAVTLTQPRPSYIRDFDEFYTQTIFKDGTIEWREMGAHETWTTFTLKPDGGVSGVRGRTTYVGNAVETPMAAEDLPTFHPDGRVEQSWGFEKSLFVAPQQVGR